MGSDDAGPPLVIEHLGKRNDRESFSCGVPALDRYLRHQASQDIRRHVSATFVIVPSGRSEILGYYTLSSHAMNIEALASPLAKKLPRYPLIPATLLGRLAVDGRHRGRGLGERLLLDALHRAWQSASDIGSVAVVVDAKDQAAIAFYRHFEFTPFRGRPDRLYLPMDTIARLFADP